MTHSLVLPELGEGISDAVIACWHVQIGDTVAFDDDFVEVVTDKASFMLPSTTKGIVTEICFDVGEKVALGQALARIKAVDHEMKKVEN